MLDELTREHSLGEDKTLLTRTRFGLGCMLDQPDVPNATFGLGPRVRSSGRGRFHRFC
jgi:hypothetical protein